MAAGVESFELGPEPVLRAGERVIDPEHWGVAHHAARGVAAGGGGEELSGD
jgi:hypothetical protein